SVDLLVAVKAARTAIAERVRRRVAARLAAAGTAIAAGAAIVLDVAVLARGGALGVHRRVSADRTGRNRRAVAALARRLAVDLLVAVDAARAAIAERVRRRVAAGGRRRIAAGDALIRIAGRGGRGRA